MGNKGNRVVSFLLIALLILNLSLVASGCRDKKKQKMEEQCLGVAENYLTYLTNCKYDKLSRYCNCEDDLFQGNYGWNESEQLCWNALLRNTTFKIGDVKVDGDDAWITVDLSIPNAKVAVKGLSGAITYSSITEALETVKAKVKATIEICFVCDYENNQARITHTTEMFELVKEQLDFIVDSIPVGDKIYFEKVDLFMQNLIDMDLKQLTQHCDSDELDDYDEICMPIYKAANEFLSYKTEFVEMKQDNQAVIRVHATLRNSKVAAQNFFPDPEKVAPILRSYILDILRGARSDPSDFLTFDDLVPGFREELEKQNDTTVDVDLTVTIDPDNSNDYKIEGDLDRILPLNDPYPYLSQMGEEGEIECYQLAADYVINNEDITEQEKMVLIRALGDYEFDPQALYTAAEKAGMVQYSGGISYINYDRCYRTSDETFMIEVIKSETIMDPVFYNSTSFEEADDMMVGNELHGTLTGGWFDFEFNGIFIPVDRDEEEKPCYIRGFVVQNYCISIQIADYTEEKAAMLNQILTEAGLA
ncbi:MAG: hypothetical protein J5379_00655 [Clostridiales bacterium]|nr:hypothetical protein [Clostridiales bacterium]